MFENLFFAHKLGGAGFSRATGRDLIYEPEHGDHQQHDQDAKKNREKPDLLLVGGGFALPFHLGLSQASIPVDARHLRGDQTFLMLTRVYDLPDAIVVRI